MKTAVPISGFDFDCLTPPFQVRFANEKETFTGIGMTEPLQLSPRMLVLADEKQIVCIYPYRDSDNTKIVTDTHTAALVGYGAPETSSAQLREAVEMALCFIEQVAGGRIVTVEDFHSSAEK
jgi:DNA/RNA-binding domain of Phe-tRNA-synthetase-like protein